MPKIVLKRNCRFAHPNRKMGVKCPREPSSQKALDLCPRYRTNEQTKQIEWAGKGWRQPRSRLSLWFSMIGQSQIGPRQLRNKCSAGLNHAFASAKPLLVILLSTLFFSSPHRVNNGIIILYLNMQIRAFNNMLFYCAEFHVIGFYEIYDYSFNHRAA